MKSAKIYLESFQPERSSIGVSVKEIDGIAYTYNGDIQYQDEQGIFCFGYSSDKQMVCSDVVRIDAKTSKVYLGEEDSFCLGSLFGISKSIDSDNTNFYCDGNVLYEDEKGIYCIGYKSKEDFPYKRLQYSERKMTQEPVYPPTLKSRTPKLDKYFYIKEKLKKKLREAKSEYEKAEILKKIKFIEKESSNPLNRATDYRLDERFPTEHGLFHLQATHREGDLISVLYINKITNTLRRKTFEFSELKSELPYICCLGGHTYMTLASFSDTKNSSKDFVTNTRSIVVDVDYYTVEKWKGIKPEYVIQDMREKGLFDGLEPSYFISSGGGLYLVYLMEDNCYRDSTAVSEGRPYAEWEKTVRNLVHIFKDYGSDLHCTDVQRVFRIPGSYNGGDESKGKVVNRYARILNFETVSNPENTLPRYSLEDIKSYMVLRGLQMPLESKQTAKGNLTPPDTTKAAKSEQTFSQRDSLTKSIVGRCNDLEKLLIMREGKNIERNNFLFVYACLYRRLHQDKEEVYAELERLNNLFAEPLELSEIRSNITVTKTYYYSNAKIIELFGITEVELNSMNSFTGTKRTSTTDRMAKRYEDRRNEEGELKSAVRKNERDALIVSLAEKGLTNQQIIRKIKKVLGVSVSIDTIKRAKRGR